MKTTILKFEHFGKKGPEVNQATIQIMPPENGNDSAIVQNITFHTPVKKMSYAQLFELQQQIVQAVEAEETEFQKHGIVTVGDAGAAGLEKGEKGVMGFRNKMKAMFHAVKGSMSNEDKKLAENAFDLVDKLLGKK